MLTATTTRPPVPASTNARTVRALVEAPDPLSLTGLRAALAAHPRITLVESAADADVAVLAVERIDDAALTRMSLLRQQHDLHLVLVPDQIDEGALLAAAERGIAAMLPRSRARAQSLCSAVISAPDGDGTMPPELLGRLLNAVGRLSQHYLQPQGMALGGLSDREVAVLRLVADGHDTAEVARRLNYSPRTIKNVIQQITVRLDLRNRTHAVAYAVRHGLI